MRWCGVADGMEECVRVCVFGGAHHSALATVCPRVCYCVHACRRAVCLKPAQIVHKATAPQHHRGATATHERSTHQMAAWMRRSVLAMSTVGTVYVKDVSNTGQPRHLPRLLVTPTRSTIRNVWGLAAQQKQHARHQRQGKWVQGNAGPRDLNTGLLVFCLEPRMFIPFWLRYTLTYV